MSGSSGGGRSLEGAFRILEHVARAGSGVTARELVGVTGMPAATVYRILNQLSEDEYLERLPSLRGFALGRRVAELTATAAVPAPLSRAALTCLERTRAEFRGGIHLALFSGERVHLVAPDPDVPVIDLDAMRERPASTAIGRLMIATTSTRRSISVDASVLPGALRRKILADGFASQIDELRVGSGCLAVPLSDGVGAVVGALSIATSSHRLRDPAELAGRLRVHGTELSSLIA